MRGKLDILQHWPRVFPQVEFEFIYFYAQSMVENATFFLFLIYRQICCHGLFLRNTPNMWFNVVLIP